MGEELLPGQFSLEEQICVVPYMTDVLHFFSYHNELPQNSCRRLTDKHSEESQSSWGYSEGRAHSTKGQSGTAGRSGGTDLVQYGLQAGTHTCPVTLTMDCAVCFQPIYPIVFLELWTSAGVGLKVSISMLMVSEDSTPPCCRCCNTHTHLHLVKGAHEHTLQL